MKQRLILENLLYNTCFLPFFQAPFAIEHPRGSRAQAALGWSLGHRAPSSELRGASRDVLGCQLLRARLLGAAGAVIDVSALPTLWSPLPFHQKGLSGHPQD